MKTARSIQAVTSQPSPLASTADDAAIAQTLNLDDLLRICQSLAVEFGLQPCGVQPLGSVVDLMFTSTVLITPRVVLMRLSTTPPDPSALDRLAQDANAQGCADYLLVSTQRLAESVEHDREHLVDPVELMALCRRSALIEWHEGRPRARQGDYSALRQRADELRRLDAFGLAWLPALSRNRLPWALRASSVRADELFEQVVYRVATTVLRLEGVRLGSASRGQRVGDALLWSRGRLALLDCKAAQDGYRLEVDDERRLLDYAKASYPDYTTAQAVACVVLVSSAFPVFDANPKLFEKRRERFRAIGSDLACVKADDLVEASLTILRSSEDTRGIDAIAWDRVLGQGLVSREVLVAACRQAVG